ncbi:hypothetical protein F5H01DRAFT_361245 [Linnemannia elongata]|nr:hypothetical protein F5H01DRAFT_361245 [Linnemannia elongata]
MYDHAQEGSLLHPLTYGIVTGSGWILKYLCNLQAASSEFDRDTELNTQP